MKKIIILICIFIASISLVACGDYSNEARITGTFFSSSFDTELQLTTDRRIATISYLTILRKNGYSKCDYRSNFDHQLRKNSISTVQIFCELDEIESVQLHMEEYPDVFLYPDDDDYDEDDDNFFNNTLI